MNGPSLPGPFLTRTLSLTGLSSSPGPLLAKTFFPLAPFLARAPLSSEPLSVEAPLSQAASS